MVLERLRQLFDFKAQCQTLNYIDDQQTRCDPSPILVLDERILHVIIAKPELSNWRYYRRTQKYENQRAAKLSSYFHEV